jgi:hypothetical protein
VPEVPDVPDFQQILAAFAEQNVRVVMIGGVAMRLHGSAHITDDVDFCYARDRANLDALARALAPHHPKLRGAPDDLPFIWDTRTLQGLLNITLKTDIGIVDMLGEAAGVDSFEGLWNRSVLMEAHGLPVRVASIDDLIAMKRAANRVKDRNHILELEALRRLIQSET